MQNASLNRSPTGVSFFLKLLKNKMGACLRASTGVALTCRSHIYIALTEKLTTQQSRRFQQVQFHASCSPATLACILYVDCCRSTEVRPQRCHVQSSVLHSLNQAHFLHKWWLDDGRWSNMLLGRKAAFPFTMLLTDCAPVQTAMDQPKIAWRALVEKNSEMWHSGS